MHTAKRTRARGKYLPLAPHQVAKAYNFPQDIDVSKQTICILELGGAYQHQVILDYCSKMGYKPPGSLVDYFVDGAIALSDGPSGADGEVGLDLSVILGVAQGVNLIVVYAPNSDQGFIDGIYKCISLNPDAISISWGSPSDRWDKAAIVKMDTAFQIAESKGIMVFVAAGDNGSSDGMSIGNHTDYPACSPYVIACGGTRLSVDEAGARSQEISWSLDSDGSGGGGGVCRTYNQPPYQKSISNKLGRSLPDISGNADPVTGYEVEVDGEIYAIGGTSAVAPLYAALCALINAAVGKRVTDWHNILYSHPEICYDVIVGQNGAYKATQGFDQVTGLGVVDGTKFLEICQGKKVNPAPAVVKSPSLWEKIKNFLQKK